MTELDLKLDRIKDLLAKYGVNALVLQRSASFAWATCGGASYINTATDHRRRLTADHADGPLSDHQQHRSAAL